MSWALHVLGWLAWAIGAALLLSAAAWCWTEAMFHGLRLVRLHWQFGEYLSHRKRFRLWLRKARGERVFQ